MYHIKGSFFLCPKLENQIAICSQKQKQACVTLSFSNASMKTSYSCWESFYNLPIFVCTWLVCKRELCTTNLTESSRICLTNQHLQNWCWLMRIFRMLWRSNILMYSLIYQDICTASPSLHYYEQYYRQKMFILCD